jgi:hypothetical protein
LTDANNLIKAGERYQIASVVVVPATPQELAVAM